MTHLVFCICACVCTRVYVSMRGSAFLSTARCVFPYRYLKKKRVIRTAQGHGSRALLNIDLSRVNNNTDKKVFFFSFPSTKTKSLSM